MIVVPTTPTICFLCSMYCVIFLHSIKHDKFLLQTPTPHILVMGMRVRNGQLFLCRKRKSQDSDLCYWGPAPMFSPPSSVASSDSEMLENVLSSEPYVHTQSSLQSFKMEVWEAILLWWFISYCLKLFSVFADPLNLALITEGHSHCNKVETRFLVYF